MVLARAEGFDDFGEGEVLGMFGKVRLQETAVGFNQATMCGGFLHKNRCWFAAPDNEASARQLRSALLETLVPQMQQEETQPLSHAEYVHRRVKAIQATLAEIVELLANKSR